MRRVLIVFVILVSSCALAQQSNPPRQRVQKTPPPTTPSAQTPTEQPPQTQEPRTARTAQPEQAPPEPSQTRRPEQQQSEGEGQQIRPMRYDMTQVPPVVTHHSIRVGGHEIRYTATAGRMPIKDAEGKIEAGMFYVAYTMDGADPSTRPL